MGDLRFKKITLNNWLEPDEVMSVFAQVNRDNGQIYPMTGEDWLQEIQKPQLNKKQSRFKSMLYMRSFAERSYTAIFFIPSIHWELNNYFEWQRLR